MPANDPLSATRLRELFNYDASSGVFTRIIATSGHRSGQVAGTDSHGYCAIRIDGVLYGAHRLAFLYVVGSWPENQVDHINMVRNDNRWANLRESTAAQNKQNIRTHPANSISKCLGVSWHKRNSLWRARIRINGRSTNLGYFSTKDAAHLAYVEAKRKFHPYGTI